MNIPTVLFIGTISILFFIGGIIFKKSYYFLGVFGSCLLMILGIILFNSPIAMSTGVSYDAVSLTYTYTNIDANLNLFISWLCILTGLGGFLITIINRNNDDQTTNKDFLYSVD